MSFANNAATTLSADITNSATTLTVQSGTGALFPTLTGSQYFYCTLENGSGSSREIVKVTARSTDTFTIVRGQDGTSGTAFVLGSKVELRLVRANLQDFALLDEANTFTQQQTVSSGIKFSDATVQTTAFVGNATYATTAGSATTAASISSNGGLQNMTINNLGSLVIGTFNDYGSPGYGPTRTSGSNISGGSIKVAYQAYQGSYENPDIGTVYLEYDLYTTLPGTWKWLGGAGPSAQLFVRVA